MSTIFKILNPDNAKCYETHENAACIQEINYEIIKYIPFDYLDVNCHCEIVHMKRKERVMKF